MTCSDCDAARVNADWRRFNTRQCLWCAARCIKKIQGLVIPAADKSSRCKAILDEAIAAGLPESEVRALAKGAELPVMPLPEKEGKKK